MSEPSPKRRRTSAEPLFEVSATGDFRPRNALRRTPPRRASWLSPTKASLARFNPEILSRRASAASAAASSAARESPSNRGQLARASVLGETQQNPDADPTLRDEVPRRQSIGGRRLPSMDILHAAGAGVDQTNAATPEGGERRLSLGGRMLPSRDVLRAAAAAQQTQDNTQPDRNPSADDDLPTHPKGSPAGEPDLPPQEGLFSSPSKRLMRNKSFGQRLSSPFKPRESQLRSEPSASDTEAGTAESTRNREVHVQGSPQIPEEDVAEQRPVPDFPMKVEVDPRQRQKELLKKQLRELQEEVKQYEREVERSRSAQRGEEEEDISSLIALVNKANPLPPAKQPEAPPLSSLLSAFLPLAKPINLPTPPPDEPEKPLPSHEPIELDDPLPYLQLFTSFSYDSKMGVTGDAGGQVHTVSMHSPASLLHLGFRMTVDSATQTVSRLEILSLSPWASHELGSYIKQRAAENDVSGVCWATESYYDLAVKRADCWARCYKGFSLLLNDSTASKTAEAGRKAKQRKGPQQAVHSSSNVEEEAEEVSGIGHEIAGKEQDGHPVSRAELMRGLGRECIVLRSKELLFKVAWRVQFDWTGEAESVVSVGVALPGVWREADDRGSLKKIPATFDRLVEEMGVFEAIKTMVELLFT